MKALEKLKIWVRSMEFVSRVYSLTSGYPRSELFGLTDQTRRAVCSIALNIAEGAGAGSKREFRRFLMMAFRSGYEVMTALRIGYNLGYLKKKDYDDVIAELDEMSAMIFGFVKSLGVTDN